MGKTQETICDKGNTSLILAKFALDLKHTTLKSTKPAHRIGFTGKKPRLKVIGEQKNSLPFARHVHVTLSK